MVLTRSAAAKLSQSQQHGHIPYMEQYYSASDSDNEESSMEIENEDTESISGSSCGSQDSASSQGSSDFDHVDDKPRLFDYFVDALLERDWLNSQFHERIVDMYIRPLLSFNGATSQSVIDHIHDITESKRVEIINVKKEVRQCDLCRLIKTTTRMIRTTDQSGRMKCIYSGRHCAERYMAVVDFYNSNDKFYDLQTTKFVDQLNKSLVRLEDAMKSGPNALLKE